MDIVDHNDTVIGHAPRRALGSTAGGHRVVHVLVLDGGGNLLVQTIAKARNRPFQRGSSVAGHLQAGESYERAAKREVEEELGIRIDSLRDLGKTWIDDGPHRKFVGVFSITHRGPFVPDAGEIDDLQWMPIEDIRRRLRGASHEFSPTFERVFRHVEQAGGWDAA